LENGEYAVGARLPSEAQLCAEFEVSRTVVREAIASLRVEGRLRSRQGSGVYVAEAKRPSFISFGDLDAQKLSNVIEVLELRLAVEVESAALAAIRHAPAQIEDILEKANVLERCLQRQEPSSKQDFALHLAIARASNNQRIVELLEAIGLFAIPRHALINERLKGMEKSYSDLIADEHKSIVSAICQRDPDSARAAMRKHLDGSQQRYRNLLNT
jgi:DNA-binding FadR family transcriptional regulator